MTERKTTENGDARLRAGVAAEPKLFMAGQVLQHVAGNQSGYDMNSKANTPRSQLRELLLSTSGSASSTSRQLAFGLGLAFSLLTWHSVDARIGLPAIITATYSRPTLRISPGAESFLAPKQFTCDLYGGGA